MESMIVLSDVCKRYHKQKVLKHINMTVNKGDIYGLVGKNGAGKTTIIKILFGLANPTSGEFTICGIQNKDTKIQSARERMSGIIEQPAFYPYMNAYDNLKIHAILCGVRDWQKIDGVLKSVGLEDVGKKKVRNFSLGMKQRLGIARALLTDANFIVLDEPTNGLDPEGIIDLRNLIKQLNVEYGITFLICSHYISELEHIITKIGIMDEGKLIKEKAIEEIRNDFFCTTHIKIDKLNLGMELLKRQGKHVVLQDGELVLYEDNININDLFALLTQYKIEIYDICKETETLEQYVLKCITGSTRK